jgi:hypothetical protein
LNFVSSTAHLLFPFSFPIILSQVYPILGVGAGKQAPSSLSSDTALTLQASKDGDKEYVEGKAVTTRCLP